MESELVMKKEVMYAGNAGPVTHTKKIGEDFKKEKWLKNELKRMTYPAAAFY